MDSFEYMIKVFGLTGLIIVLFSFMSQLKKVYDTKSGKGVSTPFLCLNVFGMVLSISHGVYYKLYEIWIPLVLSCIINGTILILKKKYEYQELKTTKGQEESLKEIGVYINGDLEDIQLEEASTPKIQMIKIISDDETFSNSESKIQSISYPNFNDRYFFSTTDMLSNSVTSTHSISL